MIPCYFVNGCPPNKTCVHSLSPRKGGPDMITSKDEGLNSVAGKALLLGGIFVDQ